jgi:hypothetical protein
MERIDITINLFKEILNDINDITESIEKAQYNLAKCRKDVALLEGFIEQIREEKIFEYKK